MKYFSKRTIGLFIIGLFVSAWMFVSNTGKVFADGYSLTMAPMNQDIIVNPGDSLKASFRISNGASSTQDTYYEIDVEPFSYDDNNGLQYKADGDSGEIVKWVKFDIPTEGKLAPNETKEVVFEIDVPESAPAGGQYLSIAVTASAKPASEEEEDKNTTIKEIKRMTHLVYAEITGNTVKTGEFLESNVPSFILSGPISGSARVKNTGNVHGKATYTLQVYPLFSGEEVYTNEENPTSFIVMPGKELFSTISWENTPPMGIFNVVFKGEFAGKKLEVSKMVIKCPVWLLFIILFAIAAVIIYFVARARKRTAEREG